MNAAEEEFPNGNVGFPIGNVSLKSELFLFFIGIGSQPK
jgi:hypothetical protein